MEEKMPRNRNSSIELLRIISMFLIVLSHFSVHGVIEKNLNFSFNSIYLSCITLGNLGVDIFILISGYYYDSKTNFKKILQIVLITIFYSVILYIFSIFVNVNEFSIKGLIKASMPILFNNYWFVTAYVLIMLFTPILKIVINNLNRQVFKYLMGLSIILYGIIPLIFKVVVNGEIYYSNKLIELIIVYFIGAYLAKYKDNIFSKNLNNTKKTLIINFIILVLSAIVMNLIGIKIDMFKEHASYFFARISPFVLMVATSIFVLISSKKSNNNILNYIGGLTFAVYLIHDNYNIREFLWKNIINVQNYIDKWYLIFYSILVSVIIFAVCCLIEATRKCVLKKIKECKVCQKIKFIDYANEKLKALIDE